MSWSTKILWGVATLIIAVRAQTTSDAANTPQCSWYWPAYPFIDLNLIDLATPTPYTCVFSVIIDVECGTDTVVWEPTAFVNGTEYTLTAPSTQLFTPQTDYVSFTFEDLIVTSLIPGEVITMTWFPGAGGEVAVPTEAIPYIPATTTSFPTETITPTPVTPPPTSTVVTGETSAASTPTPSSSSSNKAGIIAGSVVGALVVFGLAVVLGYLKYGKKNRRASRASVYSTDPYTSPDHWELDQVTGAKIPKHKGSVGA